MTGRTIAFTIPGIATPWARCGRKGGFSYTPVKQRTAMADAKVFARQALEGGPLLSGPLYMHVAAIYPWPKSTSARKRNTPGNEFKDTRPDLSNLIKLIEDALNGVAYADDGQIAQSVMTKTYGDQAEVQVTIKELLPL